MGSVVIVNSQAFPVAIQQPKKTTGRLRRMLIGWLASQSRSRRHWQRFGTTATGYRVPYRVWLHLGAYLEANQQTHRH